MAWQAGRSIDHRPVVLVALRRSWLRLKSRRRTGGALPSSPLRSSSRSCCARMTSAQYCRPGQPARPRKCVSGGGWGGGFQHDDGTHLEDGAVMGRHAGLGVPSPLPLGVGGRVRRWLTPRAYRASPSRCRRRASAWPPRSIRAQRLGQDRPHASPPGSSAPARPPPLPHRENISQRGHTRNKHKRTGAPPGIAPRWWWSPWC
jgi:hypothetical protein